MAKLIRSLTEAERATIGQLILEYEKAAMMAKQAIEQRLAQLEQRQADKLARMNFEQLMAHIRAGLLKDADFERLTDEQLWWIVAEREEPLPGESEWPKR